MTSCGPRWLRGRRVSADKPRQDRVGRPAALFGRRYGKDAEQRAHGVMDTGEKDDVGHDLSSECLLGIPVEGLVDTVCG